MAITVSSCPTGTTVPSPRPGDFTRLGRIAERCDAMRCDAIESHGGRRPSRHRPRGHATFLLAFAALATAWTGYEASSWDGIQSSNYTLASAAGPKPPSYGRRRTSSASPTSACSRASSTRPAG
jgi:hypothetical protein